MSVFKTRCIKELTHKATKPCDCGKFFRILGLHKSLFLNLEPANPQEAVDSQGTPNLTSWDTDLPQGFSGRSHFYIRENIAICRNGKKNLSELKYESSKKWPLRGLL